MLKKIILALLFKAMISLVVVVGFASFWIYNAGGDPVGLLRQVGGGMGQQAAKLGSSAGESLSVAKSKVQSTLTGKPEVKKSDVMYRWKDAAGVTHFSQEPPPDERKVETVKIRKAKPQPQPVKTANNPARDAYAQPDMVDQHGQPMPGMAGIAQQGADPAKLLQMLLKMQQSQQQ